MSLLRLAQGDAAGAYTSIKRALVAAETHAFTQARLLPAAIEIGLAAGDLDTVAKQVAELGQIADSFRTTALTATGRLRPRPAAACSGRCDNSLGETAPRGGTVAGAGCAVRGRQSTHRDGRGLPSRGRRGGSPPGAGLRQRLSNASVLCRTQGRAEPARRGHGHGCPGRRAGQENIRIHRHCGVHPPGRGAG